MPLSAEAMSRVWGLQPRGVVHVGANAAQEAASYDSNGWLPVLWVEADPLLVQKANEHISSLSRQKVVAGCVGRTDGQEVTLFLAGNEGSSSSIYEPREHLVVYPHVRFSKSLNLKTVRLDTLLAEHWQSALLPELLVLDIQGAELDALHGLGELIQAFRWIYLEVNTRDLYAGAAGWREVDRFLTTSGFALWDAVLYRGAGWGDALYGRSSELSWLQRRSKQMRRRISHPAMRPSTWLRELLHIRLRIRRSAAWMRGR